MWAKKSWSKWFEVIQLRTLSITYHEVSVLIQIWRVGSKCLKIKVLIKVFYECMNAFLPLEVRESVSELAFAFSKCDLLGLINFDFLD